MHGFYYEYYASIFFPLVNLRSVTLFAFFFFFLSHVYLSVFFIVELLEKNNNTIAKQALQIV